MKKIKNLEKVIFITLFILTISITGTIYAKENFEFKINNIEDTTPEYQKWDSLPEEEKENYIQPLPFSTQLEETNSNNYNVNLKSSLPSKYFLKDDIELTVRDQKSTSSCWAFATTNLISTNLEKIGITNRFTLFSTRHLDYTTSQSFSDGANPKGYNRQVTTGGNSYLGLAYCVAGYGPVLESDMPFENNQNNITLSKIDNKKTATKVEEYTVLPSISKTYASDGSVYYNGYLEDSEEYVAKVEPIKNQIKEYIQNYGGLSSYTNSSASYYNNPSNKGASTAYYCNNTSIVPNHAITIVGWDDNYSKDNFNSSNKPKHDGAYKILNSWGTDIGEEGYYYISYDDVLIELSLLGAKKTTNNIDYDNIYQYDELGYSNALTLNYNAGYIANVFSKKENNEYLKEVGIYLSETQNVEIYANVNSDDKTKIEKIADAGNLDSGYHTIKLENPIEIVGEKFVIAAKVSKSKENVNLPVEFNYKSNGVSSNYWDTASATSGQSYISVNGTKWYDLVSEIGAKDSNICLKAFTEKKEEAKKVSVKYQANVEKIGWQNEVKDGELSGTEGQAKQIETIKINLENMPEGAKVKYQAHVQDVGWQNWVQNGDLAGTEGQGKQIEAIKIELENMQDYSIEYRTHVQDIGWQEWISDGEMAGTTGKAKQIEAIEIRIVKKASEITINYKAHVQDIGWQNYVENGEIIGTTGKAKQIEALIINLQGNQTNTNIKYQAHVQDIGWQNWVTGGNITGTTGKAKQIEALKIELQNLSKYTIEYRAHVQDIGWQGWVKNGEIAGTTGQAKQIEALKIRLIEK